MNVKPQCEMDLSVSIKFTEAETYLLNQLFDYSVMNELLKMSRSFDTDEWRKFIESLGSQIRNAHHRFQKIREAWSK